MMYTREALSWNKDNTTSCSCCCCCCRRRFVYIHCVSKNDTDVPHYNFWRRSANFNYFWPRCCWESMLAINGDMLSHLS